MRDTGGGFGQKVVPMREDMCIMLAARKVPAALKWIEDRRENLMSAGQARHVNGTARMAFDDDGNIAAADIDFVQDIGAYPTPYPVLTTAAIGMFFPGPYRVPKASFNYKTVFSNTSGLAAYRGPWQYETLAREILLDIAARKMDVDPVELRRRNLLRRDEMPYVNPNGMPYDHVAPIETFEQAVKILDHEGFRKEQREALAQGRYLGLGFSAYIEPTGAAVGHLATEGATIRMEPTGKVNVYVNGGSSGNSLETTVIQLTADALGADIDDVATIQGDTAITPYGAGTQGSRSGPMTAGAVDEAGADPARKDRGAGRAPPQGGRRRGGTGTFDGRRARRPVEDGVVRRTGLSRVLLTAAVAAGNVDQPGSDRSFQRRPIPFTGPTRPMPAPVKSMWPQAKSRCCATSSAKTSDP